MLIDFKALLSFFCKPVIKFAMPIEGNWRASLWRRSDESTEWRNGQGQAQNGNERENAPGTRIYIGNMPYTAQRHDVEYVLELEGFKLYVEHVVGCYVSITSREAR